jgi:hypothetical protein
MVDKLRPKSIRSPGSPCAWSEEQVGSISKLIEYTDVSGGTGTVSIGTIPAGARFLGCKVWVVTAFNAGANDALIVGIPTDTNYFIEDGKPTSANTEVNEVNVLDYEPTSDVVVSAIYTHTSTAPTTGKALVTVTFKQPL